MGNYVFQTRRAIRGGLSQRQYRTGNGLYFGSWIGLGWVIMGSQAEAEDLEKTNEIAFVLNTEMQVEDDKEKTCTQ